MRRRIIRSAAFLTDAAAALAEAARDGLLPIFVGGTGLYFKALTRGLSKAPPVPADVRDAVRMRLDGKRTASVTCGVGGARPSRGGAA